MTTFTGEEVMTSGKSKENKHIHSGVFVFFGSVLSHMLALLILLDRGFCENRFVSMHMGIAENKLIWTSHTPLR